MIKLPYYEPDKAYFTNNLLLPRSSVNEKALKATLSFQIGEEQEVEEGTGYLTGRMVPRYVNLWDTNRNHVIVPRHFLWGQKIPNIESIKFEPKFEKIELPNKIVPRPAQAEALVEMEKHRAGTVNLACGRGKTVLALLYIIKRQRPAMVIVNQSALMEQWKEEIRRHIGDIPIGEIQGKKFEWSGYPIVLAMLHTLGQKRDQLTRSFKERFGVVFYDEGHHMSAPLFIKTADIFYGDRFGLTATAYRADGLENMYWYHLGPIIYQDLSQDLVPTVRFHKTNWYMPKKYWSKIRDKSGQMNHGKLCQYLGQMKERNQLILKHIMSDWASGRQLLVLSHSIEHVRRLYEMMNRPSAGLITGVDTKAVDRTKILKQCNPVFGTFQLAREALDKKELDTLYICTPFGSSNDLQQSLGRIQREFKDKQPPLARVFEDPNIKMSRNQCNRLRSYLKALGYPVEEQEEHIQCCS